MPSSLPHRFKIGRYEKICHPRAFPPSFAALSSGFILGSGFSGRGRLTVRNFRAQSVILFHIVRPRAPPRGVTYEKRRNPPARKTFINSLRNELERRWSYDVRACIRGVPKEFHDRASGMRPAPRARVKMCYIKQ